MEKNMGETPYVLHTAARTQNCYCSVNPFFSCCLPRVPPPPVYMAAQVILWLQGKTQVSLAWGREICLPENQWRCG